ncbi:L-seryl-tRNA(Sec) kinase-like [Sycon ciliatum]|uniref:L-seryl-tRNA(Sec) kinase-like n=1 Tax=Sycon ciliatum TaxID=27933 RepID=UPI0020ABBAEB|eukprot:scpid85896/ scgid11778/ L-seryl-tRNA(Sec) kinase; O-phosphoseryl-tRNA(Sec) kinase
MAELKLVLLSGLPGSGKSTLCQALAQGTSFPSCHVVVVNFDDFIGESDLKVEREALLHVGGPEAITWRHKRQHLYLSVKWLLRALNGATRSTEPAVPGVGQFMENVLKRSRCTCLRPSSYDVCLTGCAHIVIVDDNMYYGSMRYPYYSLAREFSLPFGQLHLSCSVPLAIKRNQERHSLVTPATIEKMHANMEVPGARSWETCFSTVDSVHPIPNMLELAEGFFSKLTVPPALSDPLVKLVERANAQAVTKSNTQHQIDQVLRKRISATVTNLPDGCSIQLVAVQLNRARQDLLESIKRGHLSMEQIMEMGAGLEQENDGASSSSSLQDQATNDFILAAVDGYYTNIITSIIDSTMANHP